MPGPAGRARRGHFTIYLGMAAGVGKTYRMLQEGAAELEAGRDVIIGLLETHGRAATAVRAEGLPSVALRTVLYRDNRLAEMDLPGILRRAPEVCLVDELAHSNVPGTEHPKRYEDIEDLVAAGIDVLSTMNVQHLESLNDQVVELSGVRVRETVPDSILTRADEVVLIDLSPQALLDRLRAGQIYPAERIEASLNGFFRVENLSALRELALRQVAQEVESKRLVTDVLGTRSESMAAASPQAVGERLMALVEPYAGSQRLVRRAWRSAQRLGADLDLLWVSPPGRSVDTDAQRQLAALRQLASVLGCAFLVEPGDDVAVTVGRVARERGTTYVLMGRPRRSSRWRRPLADRLLHELAGVDIRIVADRSQRRENP